MKPKHEPRVWKNFETTDVITLSLTKDQKKLLMNMLLSSLAMDQDAPEVAPPNAVKNWKEIIKQIKGKA